MTQIRFAVLGLGHISRSAVLPAFSKPEAGGAKLAAIVSGDRKKLDELGARFEVEHRATYDDFDALCASRKIDAIYIALPNDQHRTFAERAARHGVHVLCEKPLALSVEDCRAMIDACKANNVKLMTAYRLHYEPATIKAMQLIREGRIGDPRMFVSAFSFNVQPPNLRLEDAHGGGTLWDIGVYCVNAARHVFGGDEPIDVSCARFNNGEPRFSEIDEMSSVVLRFPKERSAIFTTSFGAVNSSFWRAIGTSGVLHMEPAFGYRSALKFRLNEEEHAFGAVDQFALELAHFAECIRADKDPQAEEGLKDVAVIRSLLTATKSSA